MNARPRQSLARADNHLALFSVNGDNINRLAGRDTQPTPLADRIMQHALMRAQKRAVHMANFAGQAAIGAQALNDTGIIAIGHKANILAIGLVGHHQAKRGGMLAYFILAHLRQGEAQEIELLLRR